MEQAAALPFATRHLADLGAEVIRIQSHARSVGLLQDVHNLRNKKIVELDLYVLNSCHTLSCASLHATACYVTTVNRSL